jgi:glyoxylase-like metal-dependent hydrolase (beta-lactamase superfamily II)
VNGEDVRLIPIRSAHTDGDTLVSFPGHDILAVGDYFRSTGYPYVDLSNGGSLKGLLAALDETIALAGPKTRIIPGHGPIVGRAALVAQRDMVLAVRERVAALVSQAAAGRQRAHCSPNYRVIARTSGKSTPVRNDTDPLENRAGTSRSLLRMSLKYTIASFSEVDSKRCRKSAASSPRRASTCCTIPAGTLESGIRLLF